MQTPLASTINRRSKSAKAGEVRDQHDSRLFEQLTRERDRTHGVPQSQLRYLELGDTEKAHNHEGKGERERAPIELVYERLFEGDFEINSLFRFLDLPLTDAVVAAHRDLMAEHRELDQARRLSLSSLEKFEIMKRASFGAYRQMLDMAGRQGEVRTGSKNLTI